MAEITFNAGVLAFVVRDLLDYLEFSGIVATDGTFREPTVDEYVAALDVVLKSLKDHQVVLPQGVEDGVRVLKLVLPFVLQYVNRRPDMLSGLMNRMPKSIEE